MAGLSASSWRVVAEDRISFLGGVIRLVKQGVSNARMRPP